MKLEIKISGQYKVIRIDDELEIITDLSELKFLVEGYISHGIRRIAVSFKDTSYIYSGAIAVLLECFKKLSDFPDGRLCIIEPNNDLKGVFSALNIDKILKIYDSEDDLPLID